MGENQVQTQGKPVYGVMAQFTSLIVALLIYTSSMTYPALSAISAAFPNAPSTTVKLISSIPSLMLCIFSLVAGWMTTKLSIKKCILVASGLIFVGILPAFFGGIYFLLVTRIFFGAGYGLIFPLVSALITDMYEGRKKEKMMGYKSALAALAGVVFQTMGGALAVLSWRYAFLGFLVVIPIVILIVIFLPDTGVKAAKEPKTKAGGKFTNRLWMCVFVVFFLNILQFSYSQDMSFIVTEDGIGTSLAAGNALSMVTVTTFVAGLILSQFIKITKRYAPIVAIAFVAAGFLLGLAAGNMLMFYVSAAVFGIGFGLTNPTLTLLAAGSVTDPSRTPMAISIYTSAMGIAQFLSAYVLAFVTEALGLSGSRADWQVAGVCLTAGCVVAIVYTLLTGKKETAS